MDGKHEIYFLNQGFPLADSLWQGINTAFETNFLKERYLINPLTKKIVLKNYSSTVPETFYPILLNWFKEKDTLFSFGTPTDWVSVDFRKDWSLFFRGVHSLRENMILETVKSINVFDNIMKKFNAKRLSMAESSYILEPLKGFFLAYLYWDGDEEFEPCVKVLFDKRLAVLFMQDIVWGIIVETNYRIKNFASYFSIFDS
jgi:hypothetical protein